MALPHTSQRMSSDQGHTQSASYGLIILFFDTPKFFNKPPSLSAPARLLSHNMRL